MGTGLSEPGDAAFGTSPTAPPSQHGNAFRADSVFPMEVQPSPWSEAQSATQSATHSATQAVSDDPFAMFEAAHSSRENYEEGFGLDDFPSISSSPPAPVQRKRTARADMLVGISGFTDFGDYS